MIEHEFLGVANGPEDSPTINVASSVTQNGGMAKRNC